MCYTHLLKVNSKAIIHGHRNEAPAIDAYVKVMSKTHRDFKVEHCGMIIDKHHPWIHATPDVMTSCSCCGDALTALPMVILKLMLKRRTPA